MTLHFKVNKKKLGEFIPDDKAGWEKLDQVMLDVISKLGHEKITPQKALKCIGEILEKTPQFIKGYSLAAEISRGRSEEKSLAGDYLAKGYEIGRALIPADFKGALDWKGNAEVQGFLHCQDGLIHLMLEKGGYAPALEAVTAQLAWAPGDPMGRLDDLGELRLLNQEAEKALEFLSAQVKTRPAAYYTLGLAAFKSGNYAQAISLTRKGILMLPDVAEILTGRLFSRPHFFQGQGPVENAYEKSRRYIGSLGGKLWEELDDAFGFIDWLFNSSAVLKERAAAAAIREKMFVAQDRAERQALSKKFFALVKAADEKSSEKLAAPIESSNEEKLYPWEFSDYDEDFDGDEDLTEIAGG